MIDPQLLEGLRKDFFPKFNDRIAEGYAKTQLEDVDERLHDVLRGAAKGFPDGLVYEGIERVSPQDTFKYMTHPKASYTKQQFDLSRTDAFLVKIKFSFKGEKCMDQYLFLPFVDDCSRMHIRNSLFYIKPVVADTLISVEGDYIFVPLTSTRANFYKKRYTILKNNIPEYHNMVYAMIHHELASLHRQYKNKAVKLRILTNTHYLFTKHGVLETFRRYEDTDIVVGGEEINHETYPSSKFTIVQSTGKKPEGHPDKSWVSHGIRVAVPNDRTTPSVMAMLTSMFFTLDNYPHNLTPEWILDANWWRRVMGTIVFGTDMPDSEAFNKANEHLHSVDGYFDGIAMEEALSKGIFVDDMYGFIHHLMVNFSEYIKGESEKGANCMYDKRLTVSRYIMIDVYANIYKAINFSKKKPVGMTREDVERMLSKAFKLRQVYELNKGLQYVSTIMSPADCRIFKITSSVVPQQKTQPKSGEVSKAALRDPKRRLDISHIECGAVTHLPKSHPIGDATVAPTAKTTSNGTLKPDPKNAELIARTRKLIELDY